MSKIGTQETTSISNWLILEQPFRLELIHIPAGEFLMGTDKSKYPKVHNNEAPQHRIFVSDFYMARYPITNAQYSAYLKTQFPPGLENHPVVNVSWEEAQAYCQWLVRNSNKLLRLPTEAEWEKAARSVDGRLYPWGNDWDITKHNSRESGFGKTTPVGQFSPAGDSPYGLADMLGNVDQWCSDWFDQDEFLHRFGTPVRDPQGPATGTHRVVRGSSFVNFRKDVRCASRGGGEPNYRARTIGFRVAASFMPLIQAEPLNRPIVVSTSPAKAGPPKEPATVATPPPTPQPNPDRLTLDSPFHLELIRIPAGEFLMGSDKAKDRYARDNELPQHNVYVSEFYIGRYPITNVQYAAFKKIRMPSGQENHPVINVSWNDAQTFCQWLVKQTGKASRLPTEAEWEKAARGINGRIYPWGNERDKSKLNSSESGVNGTTPVGIYSPVGDSPYGLADMGGNVWEWCADWYDEKEYQRQASNNINVRDPQGPASGENCVLRGGSYSAQAWYARCACRVANVPQYGDDL